MGCNVPIAGWRFERLVDMAAFVDGVPASLGSISRLNHYYAGPQGAEARSGITCRRVTLQGARILAFFPSLRGALPRFSPAAVVNGTILALAIYIGATAKHVLEAAQVRDDGADRSQTTPPPPPPKVHGHTSTQVAAATRDPQGASSTRPKFRCPSPSRSRSQSRWKPR